MYNLHKGSAENHESDSTIFLQQIRENKHIFLKLKILGLQFKMLMQRIVCIIQI